MEQHDIKFNRIINLLMNEELSLSEAIKQLKETREDLVEEYEEIIDEKNKTIDALIKANNFMSTEAYYYKTHWFTKLFDETSDWVKDTVMDMYDRILFPYPVDKIMKNKIVKKYIFDSAFKKVSLKTTAGILGFIEFSLTYRSIRLFEIYIYNFIFLIFAIHYMNHIFKLDMVCYMI